MSLDFRGGGILLNSGKNRWGPAERISPGERHHLPLVMFPQLLTFQQQMSDKGNLFLSSCITVSASAALQG